MAEKEASETWKTFDALLSKAHHKFNKLRDLPTFGTWAWERDYHKAFKTFSSLWKFQQDKRSALVEAGLKRSDIGEVASKIGQLYYNFYLRTADTRFLTESYVFYQAIHTRQYFAEVSSSMQLSIKQLRFYARFIIVCLLLNRKEEAWNLLQTFQALISAYIMRFNTADSQDWQLVIHEITTFLNSDVAMPPPRSPGTAMAFRPILRCCPSGAEASVAPHHRRVREAVLVSYQQRQVKIAELPVDVFRIMQTLEWHNTRLTADSMDMPAMGGPPPQISEAAAPADNNTGQHPSSAATVANPALENPPKQLFYRTNVLTLLNVLFSTASLLSRDDILFMYLSGQGIKARAEAAASKDAKDQSAASPQTANGPSATTAAVDVAASPTPGSDAKSTKKAEADKAPETARAEEVQSHSSAHLIDQGLQQGHPSNADPMPQPSPAQPVDTQALQNIVDAERQYISQAQQASDQVASGNEGQAAMRENVAFLRNKPASGSIASSTAGASLPAASVSSSQSLHLLPQSSELSTTSNSTNSTAAPTAAAAAAADLPSAGSGGELSAAARHSSSGAATALPAAAASADTAAGAYRLTTGPFALVGLCLSPPKGQLLNEVVLCPDDLLPLTRRQLFLIIDSDISTEFRSLSGREQGFPVLCLFSPTARPPALLDYSHTGSLFAMFLSCPVMAMCVVLGELDPAPAKLGMLQDTLNEVLHDLGRVLLKAFTTSGGSGASSRSLWGSAFNDALLRQHIIRFVLCRAALAHHVATRGNSSFQPSCSPELPPSVAASAPTCQAVLQKLAAVFGKQSMFQQL